MTPAIDLQNVSKTYGRKVHALRGVSVNVRQGEIFGLLGPNGAGKSTLVKILMTVIRPTTATGTVLGAPLGDKSSLARVGYLPEAHRFPRYLTGRQVLELFGGLAGLPRQQMRRRSDELLEFVGMKAWADKKVTQYSKGMMQRVGIAQALVHDPQLVLLDEPTDGVDPVGRRDIRDMLQRLRERGVTVLINSHLLSELEMVCDRVAIMLAGKIERLGTLAELAVGRERYLIEVDSFDSATVSAAGLPPLPADLSALGLPVSLQGNTVVVNTADPHLVQPAIDLLRRRGLVVTRVSLDRPNLENLFIEAVGSQTR
jgi:ABC-2 type transport system ATP-binding protein